MFPRGFLHIASWTTGILVLVVASYGMLLAHPESLFAHSVTHQGIIFYSQAPLAPQVADIARGAGERLATSDLDDPDITHRVFVVERPWLWYLLNGPYHRAIARNVELGNPILVPTLDVPNEIIRHFDGRGAGAVAILTHEMAHTLVQRRIGVRRVWALEWWQREGYPEYLASQGATRSEAPPRYQDAARRWKVLLEDRRLTFDQVVEAR